MKNKKKDLEYYLNLPWTYRIETDMEDGEQFYIVCVNELPGICTDNSSLDDAMKDIKEVIAAAITLYMKHDAPIPEPVSKESYKGNIAYRTTSSRHYIIAKEAARRGISLSQMIDQYVDASITKRRR